MSGLLPRDHFQRRNGRSSSFAPSEDDYRRYRVRSPSPTRHMPSRSRSPAREPRARFASTHSYDFSPPSLSSSRHPSYDLSGSPPRRPSTHSHRAPSSSHNHRDGTYYYGSSEWSTNHGNHSPEWPGPLSTTPSERVRQQRRAPHHYGDDELPYYSTASEYARSPSPPVSYTSSRDRVPSHSSRHAPPPPSYRSGGSGGSRYAESSSQLPATRRPSHFYPSDLPGRNYFIDKNGRYER